MSGAAWLVLALIFVASVAVGFVVVQRYRRRRALRRALAPIRESFIQFQIEVVDQLTPALERMAEAVSDMAPALQRLGDAFRKGDQP